MRMSPTYLQKFLSDSARKAKRSEIRELLKLIAKPEVVTAIRLHVRSLQQN